MGLKQILLGTQPGFQYYGESLFPNPNAVSSKLFFGQKSIGYGESLQPFIQIPLPENANFIQPGDNLLLDISSDINTGIFATFGMLGGDYSSNWKNNIRYNPKSWGPDFINRGNLFGLVRSSDDSRRLEKYFYHGNKPGGSINGLLFTIKQNLLSRIAVKTESVRLDFAYGAGFFNEGVYLPSSTILQSKINFLELHLRKQGIDPTGFIPGLSTKKYQLAQKKLIEEDKNRLNDLIGNKKSYLYKYGGGPGSTLGIGWTKIHYATDNLGIHPIKSLVYKTSTDYSTYSIQDIYTYQNPSDLGHDSFQNNLLTKEIKPSSLNESRVYSFLSLTPDYNPNNPTTGNIETRVNFKSGGVRGNRYDYTVGKILPSSKTPEALDKINATEIYQATSADIDSKFKDLIDFRIAIINNKTLSSEEITSFYLHFRAFLDDFGDNYSSEWKKIEYSGRGEEFHKYGGFARKIELGFTLFASSKDELMPMYRKLNFLASSFSPSYSDYGYMMGNLVRLTVGDYLYEQMGFFSSLDISIPESSPWEINVPTHPEKGSLNLDPYVRQVPHMLKVKLRFTPIQDFRPEIQTLEGGQYGPQRFISLENSELNTQGSYDPVPDPPTPTDEPSTTPTPPITPTISSHTNFLFNGENFYTEEEMEYFKWLEDNPPMIMDLNYYLSVGDQMQNVNIFQKIQLQRKRKKEKREERKREREDEMNYPEDR